LSKLNPNKINFNENDFFVEVSETNIHQNNISKQEILLNRIQDDAQKEIESAQEKAKEIIKNSESEAQKKSQDIINSANKQANEIIEQAQKQANDILEEANSKKNELLTNSELEIEKASQEAANKGYEDGYNDAQNKFFEENEKKMKEFDEFCICQNSVREKILKNASREILNIIQNISKAVLLKEIDAQVLAKIIKNTITLFDKKENITIIVSEKYAKLLYELQKKELDIELNFDDFKQYHGFDVIYNNELPEDTIIVENKQERFCASITQQLDKIIRNILENTQNGNIDVEEYDETPTTE